MMRGINNYNNNKEFTLEQKGIYEGKKKKKKLLFEILERSLWIVYQIKKFLLSLR